MDNTKVREILKVLYDKTFSFDELQRVSEKHGNKYLAPLILRRYTVPSFKGGPMWAWKYTLTSEAKISANPDDIFSDIEGHDDKKLIIKNFLHAKGNVNLLLLGWYGTGKSLFIRDIKEKFPSVYVEGANSTPVGILDLVREKVQKYGTNIFLLIDEIDKMVASSKDPAERFRYQNALSNLIDTMPRLNKTKFDLRGDGNMAFDIKLDGFKTIATANDLSGISRLLLERFGNYIEFKPYTKDELYKIGVRILMVRYGKPMPLAIKIARFVTEEERETNVREIDKLGELIHTEDELEAYKKITKAI